ncbi:MAG: hypothetical protein NXH75_15255 [Halobacteriovoraceae bacterium]|nr:hypothetical protein [Halobacteriovoraceae bacterium]
MTPNKWPILILIALISFNLRASLVLEEKAETFIVDQTDSHFLVQVLNGSKKGENFLVSKTPEVLTYKLYGKSPIDQLLAPVHTTEKAFYLTVSFETKVEEYKSPLTSAQKERMEQNLFTSLSDHLPISNENVPELADDDRVQCPMVPKRKNGEDCFSGKAHRLPRFLKDFIKETAEEYGQDPYLVMSIIHQESQYDLFMENLHEKNKCLRDEKNCSAYRWGIGLAQLGKTDAHFYGLDWEGQLKRPRVCKGSGLLNLKCWERMNRNCQKYEENTLKPINCPKPAIQAIVKKIKSLIPTKVPAWLEDKQKQEVFPFDLSSILKRDKTETIRNLVGYYNRTIKVTNSFIEYYDHKGSFPETFGQAWSMPRTSQAPSKSIGYQLLTKEYINRCYVWKVAGLCGTIPSGSLYSQYKQQ